MMAAAMAANVAAAMAAAAAAAGAVCACAARPEACDPPRVMKRDRVPTEQRIGAECTALVCSITCVCLAMRAVV